MTTQVNPLNQFNHKWRKKFNKKFNFSNSGNCKGEVPKSYTMWHFIVSYGNAIHKFKSKLLIK